MNDFMRFDSKDAGSNEFEARAAASSAKQTSMKESNYMFVPPFNSLLRAIGITREEFENSAEVVIPTELFKLLLQVTIVNSDFNTVGYLKANPDVAEAIRNGSRRMPECIMSASDSSKAETVPRQRSTRLGIFVPTPMLLVV